MTTYHHNSRPGIRLALALLAIAAIIVADQYTKWFVMENMLRAPGTVPDFGAWFFTQKKISPFLLTRETFQTVVLAPWLNFIMVWNQGVSFGLFDTSSPVMPLVFMGISVLVSLLLLIWLAVSRGRIVSVALPLIIGGALGNVLDRIRFAAVVDFIDAHWGDKHWPAFNLADSCIVLGAILLTFARPGGQEISTEGKHETHA